MDSSGEKPWRRWFRLRFGLRTLLLLVTAVAVWLSYETRRAQNQEALVARVEAMGGQCQRVPREWIPLLMQRLLDESQGSFVTMVSVEAMQAPTRESIFPRPLSRGLRDKLFEPADVEELLRMPGMGAVRKLQLQGTSVTDDVVDELAALGYLESITFDWTAVTEEAARKLEASRPDCTVVYSTKPNGPTVLIGYHTEALLLTEDLTLFPRAQRGDPEAIEGLLMAIDADSNDGGLRGKFAGLLKEAQRGDMAAINKLASARRRGDADYPFKSLSPFLSQIDWQSMQEPLADTLRNGGPEARLLAVELLVSHGQVGLLREAHDDPLSRVRTKAVLGLSEIGSEAAARGLVDACRNTDPKVREVAVRELSSTVGREGIPVYLEAITDGHVDVRWQAVHALERHPDPLAVQPLIVALHDESSLVRCAAVKALGKIADPCAVGPLEAAAKDTDSFVREAAELALVAVGAESKE
jgi:HEAT repeat protein